mmetsp:Transcript_788/g.2873  ORF Transcript_788/g.2873 Transcript_788/m.2873 type:complete len:203 (-) Transcript_788:770-1378(-)
MFVLGLTGSIGMGKSTVSSMFREERVPVLDADAVVHQLYAKGGKAVAPVGAAFPGVVIDGAISRPELGKHVVGMEENMKRLEAIVHPLVEEERNAFLSEHRSAAAPLVVLDIPLLFETHLEHTVDAVAVASTGDAAEQRRRVLARPGMAPDKLDAILARQVPDEEKRRRAAYIIDTSKTLEQTKEQVHMLVEELSKRTDTPT